MSDHTPNDDPGLERRRESDRVLAELGRLAHEAGERLARLDDHKQGLEGLKGELADSRVSVDRLSVALEGFVPRQEAFDVTNRLNRRRRSGIAWLIFTIVAAMFVTDYHTEQCGPGARTEKVVQAIVNQQVSSMEDFNRIVREATPDDLCDAMFPIHTHDPGDAWPTQANIVGLSLAAFLFLLGVAFVVNGLGLEPNVSVTAPKAPIPDDVFEREQRAHDAQATTRSNEDFDLAHERDTEDRATAHRRDVQDRETDSTTNHGKDGPS